jgi:ribosomal protein S18 acetylase RimI-like enzyme
MIVIERMRPAHLPLVLAHEHDTFGTESWSEGMYRDELADAWNRHYLVAFDVPDAPDAVDDAAATGKDAAADPALVGWAGLLVIDRTAQILTIGTVAAARRRGVARALMDRLLGEARRRHAVEALLEVRVDNAPAKAMYAGYGFEEVGIRKGYYQPAGVDAAVLRLDLSRPAPPAAAR